MAQKERIAEKRAIMEERKQDVEAAEQALDNAQRELDFVREVGGGFWAPEIDSKRSKVAQKREELVQARCRLTDAMNDLRDEESWAI